MTAPTFDPGFSTQEMTELFSAEALVVAMCRTEAALAAASAEAGMIDHDIADEITSVCNDPVDDSPGLLTRGWELGSPVIPLLEHLRSGLSAEAAAALHRGATTQDIVDTALMIQAGQAIAELDRLATATGRRLHELAVQHRETPVIARTMLQRARPTTFGLRAAQWLAPLADDLDALRRLPGRLVVQLGGPSGIPFDLGDRATSITDAMARRLGLHVPVTPWHTDRTPITGIVGVLQGIARSVARIANDLILLAQNEIGEVSMRPGGSSSMPDKRNPFDAVHALAASQVTLGVSVIVTGAIPHELERAAGAWHAEWFAVPVAFQATAAALEAIGAALGTVELDHARTQANLGADPDPALLTMAGRQVDEIIAVASPLLWNDDET